MAGNYKPRPSVRGHQSSYARVGLDDYRHTPEKGTRSALRPFPVLARGCFESALEVAALDGLIDAVVFFDSRDVPLDNLRDRIAMRLVKMLKPRNRDLGEIAVHGSRVPGHEESGAPDQQSRQ